MPLFDRSVEISARALGPDHPNFATTLIHLALSLSKRDQHEHALKYIKRAVEIFERSLGSEHPRTTRSRALYEETKLQAQSEALPSPISS